MTDRWREPMVRWAHDRDLEFTDEGLLPPWSRSLAAGLGAGSHRAGLVIARSRHSTTSVGGFKKYPERSTHHLCRGRLPGGIEGVVAHQLHLHLQSTSDGETWKARPDTVVVARVPEGARVARELYGAPAAGGELRVGRVLDLSGGSAGALPGAPGWHATIGTHHWTADPPEDPVLLAELLGAGVEAALAAAHPETTVELRYGVICVTAPHAITDPGALDALCHVAAAVAAGVRRAAALLPPLDADQPLPAPAETERSRWIDAGVARVQWHAPPASVPAAAAAYAQAIADEARTAGRQARRITGVGAVIIGLLALLAAFALGAVFGDPLLWTIVVVVVGAPFTLWGMVRGTVRAGREATQSHIAARATPWGIEAFAREYGRARGLVLEDVDAFRHRFDSPVPGIPLKVLRGARMRLVLWLDPTDRAAKRYFLLAVAPAPEGPVPGPPADAPYTVHVQAGHVVLALEVPDEGRSAANLDALAAALDSHVSGAALTSA